MQTSYITSPVFPGTVVCAIPLAIAGSSSSGFYITHILGGPFSETPQQSPAFLDPQTHSIQVPPNLICLSYLLLPDYNSSLPLDELGPDHYTTEPFSVPGMSSFQPFTVPTVPFTNSIEMPTQQARAFTNGSLLLEEPYLPQSSSQNISPCSCCPTFHPVDQAPEDQAFVLDPLPVHSTQDTFVFPEQLSTSLTLDSNLVMNDSSSQGPFLAPPILTGSSPMSRQTQSYVGTGTSY